MPSVDHKFIQIAYNDICDDNHGGNGDDEGDVDDGDCIVWLIQITNETINRLSWSNSLVQANIKYATDKIQV